MDRSDRESLCWDCKRAYALLDEDGGCPFHRREPDTRELEGHPYSESEEEYVYTLTGGYTIIKVLGCNFFIRSEEREINVD